MSDPITGELISRLGGIIEQQIKENIELVVNVDEEIEKLRSTLISIQAVILDADNKQVEEHSIRLWLQRLGDVCYDLDDVLAEWSSALLNFQRQRLEKKTQKKRLSFFITYPCFCFGRIISRRDIAIKIKDLHKKLNEIHIERQNYSLSSIISSSSNEKLPSNSFVKESQIKGRDRERTFLVGKLLTEREEGLKIVSLVGMGGIGKTTLAQLAYNSAEVKDYFELRLWVVVSEQFELVRICKAIIETIQGTAPQLNELNNVLQLLRQKIQGKRFLLILDDAWTADLAKWEPLVCSLSVGNPGSTLLVTTRNEKVARILRSNEIIQVGVLSDTDCWNLFQEYAFFGDRRNEGLKAIGKEIAKNCKGLPLAAKTTGSLMRFKRTVADWENVLTSVTWDLDTNGFLMLSYYALEEYTWRRCFRYCAVFPKNTVIQATTLIKMWMANGYLGNDDDMEARGRECLDNLAMRSFFQDLETDYDGNIIRFRMHDLIHDLARFLSENDISALEMVDSLPRTLRFRHLTLSDVPVQSIQGGDHTNKLHTLRVQSTDTETEFDKFSPELFKHLKVLDINGYTLKELHSDIGKLFNLRFLNLSNIISLEELPETLCDLYNLQTLNLIRCRHLKRLPQEISRLENLRHLLIKDTNDLKLPKGVGQLRFLQTLCEVVLSSNLEEFNLGDLKDLNLRGGLVIKQLQFADVADVKTAELKKKKHLAYLTMDFRTLSSQEEAVVQARELDQNCSQEEAVAEALEIHPDVVRLEIFNYHGARLPNWIVSVNNLCHLLLHNCPNCTSLPPLGKLQSLISLRISLCNNLKRIGDEFLGIEAYYNGAIDIFPKLQWLRLKWMQNLEEVNFTSEALAKGVEEGSVRIMPCLEELRVHHCPLLKVVPQTLKSKCRFHGHGRYMMRKLSLMDTVDI